MIDCENNSMEKKQNSGQRHLSDQRHLSAATDRPWTSAHLNGHHLLLSSPRQGGELGVQFHVGEGADICVCVWAHHLELRCRVMNINKHLCLWGGHSSKLFLWFPMMLSNLFKSHFTEVTSCPSHMITSGCLLGTYWIQTSRVKIGFCVVRVTGFNCDGECEVL